MPARLQKLRHFMARPRFQRLWFLPTWLLLGGARLLIQMLPMRYLVSSLGYSSGTAAVLPLIDSAQTQRAIAIGHTVQVAARYTPWESNCFPQALTARFLLGLYRIPTSVFFGVRRSPDFAAHAWVAAGRVCVVGGYSFNEFNVVNCLVSTDCLPRPPQR